MDRLRGRTILIGRSPDDGRLCVGVLTSGHPKVAKVNVQVPVPACVSRCKPAEGTAHCSVQVDQSGNMTLTNMKPGNATYVDGLKVVSKRVSRDSSVSLGKDRYPLDLGLVLDAAMGMLDGASSRAGAPGQGPAAQGKQYGISHLGKVWDEYEGTMADIQRLQEERGRKRMLPIMIGSVSAVLSPILGFCIPGNTYWITMLIAAISLVMYLRIYFSKDTTTGMKKDAQDRLIDEYVCPNPSCGHFMGFQPYKVLRQGRKCPYCGCAFMEKQG